MTERALLERAVQTACSVRQNSYSPYSGFAVGATVITASGDVFSGTNVENSSFGATVCAERAALFAAVAAGNRKISAVVIASEKDGTAVYPCGICRQVLAEFNPAMEVHLVNAISRTVEKTFTLDTIHQGHFSLDSR